MRDSFGKSANQQIGKSASRQECRYGIVMQGAKKNMSDQTKTTEKTELEMTLRERVEAALDKVRPNLQRDGGDIELLDVVDGVAKVKLQGSCAGCPMSQMTLTWGVEQALRKEVPEIVRVETDRPLPSFGGMPFANPIAR